MVAAAAVLTGREEDAARFDALADRTREAFNKHYVQDIDGAGGTITSDAPSVYALAIAFDMLDNDDRRRAGDRLAALAAENGYHVATGFAGTRVHHRRPELHGSPRRGVRAAPAADLPLVALPGHHGCDHHLGALGLDAARRLRINPGEMTSFNHYALGAVADWLHRTVGGLAPRGARLPPGPGSRPQPRRRPDLGVDQLGDGARARQLTLAHRRRRPHARRCPSRRCHGGRVAARRTGRRGRRDDTPLLAPGLRRADQRGTRQTPGRTPVRRPGAPWVPGRPRRGARAASSASSAGTSSTRRARPSPRARRPS